MFLFVRRIRRRLAKLIQCHQYINGSRKKSSYRNNNVTKITKPVQKRHTKVAKILIVN